MGPGRAGPGAGRFGGVHGGPGGRELWGVHRGRELWGGPRGARGPGALGGSTGDLWGLWGLWGLSELWALGPTTAPTTALLRPHYGPYYGPYDGSYYGPYYGPTTAPTTAPTTVITTASTTALRCLCARVCVGGADLGQRMPPLKLKNAYLPTSSNMLSALLLWASEASHSFGRADNMLEDVGRLAFLSLRGGMRWPAMCRFRRKKLENCT